MNNISSGDQNRYMKPIYAYFDAFPPEKMVSFHDELNALPLAERGQFWESNKDVFVRLESLFPGLLKGRNELAKSKGFENYIEMSLRNAGISKLSYDIFMKLLYKTIEKCNDELPDLKVDSSFYSEFNQPCFLCGIEFPNLEIPQGIFKMYLEKYPMLSGYKNMVRFEAKEKSVTKYIKENNEFLVSYRTKVNRRHQTLDIVHELGHVVSLVDKLNAGGNVEEISRFEAEKKAIRIEIDILKAISPVIYQAFLGDVLIDLHKIMFEISAYENPSQNMPELYAGKFNEVFKKASQKENHLYLIEENISLRSLVLLPYAISYSEILSGV